MLNFDASIPLHSIYIHWPFCPYKCHFCPFVALAGHDQYMQDYHAALLAEMKFFGAKFASKCRLDTIFIGGGTPSTYPDELLLDMSGTLKDIFDISDVKEISIEVNPGTVRQEQLALWRKAGINRLSIGVQSLKDSVLHALNRKQQAGDVYWLIERASQEFTNISIDLIVGLPGVSEQEWKRVIQTIATWPITHVSIYFLTVHEDTPLYFKVQTQKISLPLEDKVVDSYLWAIDYLAQQGFEQYEISNFARPGFRSQHNSMYWQRKPFKGFGLGAWSFDGQRRLQNQKNLMQYMNDAQSSGQVTLFGETLNAKQEHLEQIMLGLRQKSGVAIEDLCRQKIPMHIDFNETIAELIDKGYMQQNNSRIWLTPLGFTMHQSVVTKLSCEH